jgi:hypothetical protein
LRHVQCTKKKYPNTGIPYLLRHCR